MEDIEKLEQEMPNKEKIRFTEKGKKGVVSYKYVYAHHCTKGRWIEKFIESNVGRNFDKTLQKFIRKVTEEHVDQKYQDEMIQNFHSRFTSAEDEVRGFHNPYMKDKQGRIVRDKEAWKWRKKEPKAENTKKTLVGMRLKRHDIAVYPELFEALLLHFTKKEKYLIEWEMISISFYNKYFVGYKDKYGFVCHHDKIRRFVDTCNTYFHTHKKPYWWNGYSAWCINPLDALFEKVYTDQPTDGK